METVKSPVKWTVSFVIVIGSIVVLYLGFIFISSDEAQANLVVLEEKLPQPHIVFILADDLGWRDVGYHNSFVYTPTIDQLAAEGVKLEKFYVNSICTPSRSALMSGRYVTHTGLQHLHIDMNQARGLSLNCTLLPEALRSYGYRNYMVGKWHLGFYKEAYVPHKRGFDKFYGIYGGQSDHYDFAFIPGYNQLNENGQFLWENSTYDAHLYVNKAKQYIDTHLEEHPDKPMFLYTAFTQVHTPLQVPEQYETLNLNRTRQRPSENRLKIAGMATCMDEGIKNLTQHLKDRGMWNNTILFFISDNGGHTTFGSDNSPLRGGKATLFEGGIRAAAFLHGRGVKSGQVSHRLYHMTDIYPTLLSLARRHWMEPEEKAENKTRELEKKVHDYLPLLDGHDVWDSMTNGVPSPRREVLINIDPKQPRLGASLFPDIYDTGIRSGLIAGKWKILTGWVDYPFWQWSSSVKNFYSKELNATKNVALYNLKEDPYEKTDLFFKYPNVVKAMLKKLQGYKNSSVSPQAIAFTYSWHPKINPNFVGPWLD